MSEILQTKFNTEYEPKIRKRFAVDVTDGNGESLIPTYVIKETSIPSFRYNWFGFKKYYSFRLSLYNPVVPSSTQLVFDALKTNKVNIHITILGPCGDKIEEWKIKNAKIESVVFDDYDWNNESPAMIQLDFKIKDVILLY